jgi:hypothetical protein
VNFENKVIEIIESKEQKNIGESEWSLSDK